MWSVLGNTEDNYAKDNFALNRLNHFKNEDEVREKCVRLCAKIVEGTIEPNLLSEKVEEILSKDNNDTYNIRQILVDSIWLYGNQIQQAGIVDDDGVPAYVESEVWKRLTALTRNLREKNIVPIDMMKIGIPIELLDSAGIATLKLFKKKIVKMN